MDTPGPKRSIMFDKSFVSDPLGAYSRMWDRYGDFFRLPVMPGMSLYVAVDPDAVGHIFLNHGKTIKKSKIVHKPLALLIGEGMVISEGANWKRQRRLVQPAFSRSALEKMSLAMIDEATRFADELTSMAKDAQVLDVCNATQALTFAIVGKTLFGTDLGARTEQFGERFRRAANFVNSLISKPIKMPLWIPTGNNRRFLADRKYLYSVATDLIKERRASNETPHDLLQMMMDAHDGEDGSVMSDQELLDQLMTMMTAGHETVSVTLAWALHLMAIDPSKRDAMEAEIDSVIGTGAVLPEHAKQLPYTRGLVMETLRLYPPVWSIARETQKDDEIIGHPVPKGSMVLAAAYLTHRHPKYWPNPLEFEPERFVNVDKPGGHTFAYYPFAAGPRICIGHEFAMIEATLILAKICQKLRLVHADGEEVVADPTFTLRPKNLRMKIELRH
jgi:cytochrome P450